MRPRLLARLLIPFFTGLLWAGVASADVVRVDIRRRDDAGTHVRVIGRVYFAIDPRDASSREIADIGVAPTNAAGLVEFASDLLLFVPKTGSALHRTAFLEVVNRGRDQSLGLLSGAEQTNLAPQHWNLGDRFVLKQGFTMAFLGWQFDVKKDAGLTFDAPVAAVDGLVRATYIGGGRATSFPVRYCAADSSQADATLTVRSQMDAPGTEVPRQQWRFSRDGCTIQISAGPPAGLFEAVYRAHGSPVAGLGLAAIRDFVSFLKHGGPASALGDGALLAARVIGFGYSQSGRLLREFVRDGFNRDTRGRRAFDGLIVASAGAGGGSFNHRFAWPGDAGNSVLSIMRPVDLPPFTDAELLARAVADDVVPRIFYTLSSTEYWARAASLTHTDATGSEDRPPAPTSRIYFLAGTPHANGPLPPQQPPNYAHPLNFAEQRWTLRALTVAMDAWLRDGTEPPASRYPTISDRTLVRREDVRFPSVPSLPFPVYMPRVWRLDFGESFLASRVISREPPIVGAPYAVLVPAVDLDGIDLGGVRGPDIQAALGTHTGWNLTAPALPQLDYLAGLAGAFAPFAATARTRAKTDLRLAIVERYKDRAFYLSFVKDVTSELIAARFVLAADMAAIVDHAKLSWAAIVERERQ